MKCPTCNAEIVEGALFCEECGTKMEQVQSAPPEQEGGVRPEACEAVAPPEASLEGEHGKRAIVLKDSGKEITLPEKDEITIGREDPISEVFPDVDLTPYGGDEGGVSRLHCRIVKNASGVVIEDMKSTNATFVNKKRLAPNTPHPLADGDEIRLGKVVLVYKNAA